MTGSNNLGKGSVMLPLWKHHDLPFVPSFFELTFSFILARALSFGFFSYYSPLSSLSPTSRARDSGRPAWARQELARMYETRCGTGGWRGWWEGGAGGREGRDPAAGLRGTGARRSDSFGTLRSGMLVRSRWMRGMLSRSLKVALSSSASVSGSSSTSGSLAAGKSGLSWRPSPRRAGLRRRAAFC